METETIKWYKVHISLFKENAYFVFKLWEDVITYLNKFVGFDVTITGQKTDMKTYVLNNSSRYIKHFGLGCVTEPKNDWYAFEEKDI